MLDSADDQSLLPLDLPVFCLPPTPPPPAPPPRTGEGSLTGSQYHVTLLRRGWEPDVRLGRD